MAKNHEREGKDILEDGNDTCMYDPLLDDLDLETLMEDEDCGIGGAEEDPAHKMQEDVVTREKPGTPGGERDGNRSSPVRLYYNNCNTIR